MSCPYCKGLVMRERDRQSPDGAFDDDAYGLDIHYECTCHTDKPDKIKCLLEWIQIKVRDLIQEEGSLDDLHEWLGDLTQDDIEQFTKPW